MELEERSIEQLPERCQNCGARLTSAEKARALEEASGGPVLCTICASDQVPLGDEEAEEPEAGY
jgi:hypothetical protein